MVPSVYLKANGADYSNDGSYSDNGHEIIMGNTLVNPVTSYGWIYSGKSFSHWNTRADDSGTSYMVDDRAYDPTMYAIWLDTVTNLTGTEWYFNGNLGQGLTSTFAYSINFTSNNTDFSTISAHGSGGPGMHYLWYDSIQIHDPDVGLWTDQAYRTITITGGTDVTNSALISWLYDNATLQSVAPAPASELYAIYYKGEKIYSSSSEETITLATEGKYLEDDIRIELYDETKEVIVEYDDTQIYP